MRPEQRLEADGRQGRTDVRLYAQLGLRLPAELAVRLKRFCSKSRRSLNQTVIQALEQYLATKPPGQ